MVVEKRAREKSDADTIEVHTEQNGNHIVVDVLLPAANQAFGFNWSNSRSAKLIVSVPAAADLRAKSGDGSIEVERVTGTIALRSGDGRIQGRDLSGDVKIHTGDGSINLEGVTGSFDADTGDGSIAITGKLTAVRAWSGDGSVTIHAAPGSATSADWNISTGDGAVTVEIPEGFGGELDAHTGDGGIRMQGVTVSDVTGQISKNTVRGRLGAGGRAFRVRTGDGSITLRRF